MVTKLERELLNGEQLEQLKAFDREMWAGDKRHERHCCYLGDYDDLALTPSRQKIAVNCFNEWQWRRMCQDANTKGPA